MDIKEQWKSFPSDKKRTFIIAIIIGILIIFSVIAYYITRPKEKSIVHENINTKKEISLDPKLLEKTYIAESEKQMDYFKQELEKTKSALEEEKKTKENLEIKQKELLSKSLMPSSPPSPPMHGGGQSPNIAFPPPPPPPSLQSEKISAPAIDVIGGIDIVSAQTKAKAEQDKSDDKKKEDKKIYLPPSFMEATLLSGLDAPAIGDGKNNPVPVLLRVKDIAVLPNKVKANLKGCFVIADGNGSLADERAHLRLVSLSCVAKNGQSIIDQKVKGFVVDEDGKVGLKGRVVSKMGSAIARTFLAGMFGGIGDAIKASQVTTMTSAIGTTQTTTANKFNDIMASGIGGGIASAAQEIQKFYLELAKQAIPVIEVGATKIVTLIISEGTEINIKDYHKDDKRMTENY